MTTARAPRRSDNRTRKDVMVRHVLKAATEEQRVARSALLDQLRGVAMCQALGLRYVDEAPALAAEIGWHDAIAERGSRHAHRGAILGLADQAMGTAVMVARGHRAAQATISLRLDWLALPPPGAAIRCTVEEAMETEAAALIRARVDGGADGAMPIAVVTGQFIQGANPGGSSHGALFEGEPPEEPFAELPDFETFLGLEEMGNGYGVPVNSRLVGHPFVPSVHGGMVAAALDEAAWLSAKNLGATRALTSSTTYLRPVVANRLLRIDVDIVRHGRAVVIMRARGWQDSPDRPAAVAELVALTGGRA